MPDLKKSESLLKKLSKHKVVYGGSVACGIDTKTQNPNNPENIYQRVNEHFDSQRRKSKERDQEVYLENQESDLESSNEYKSHEQKLEAKQRRTTLNFLNANIHRLKDNS